MAIARGVQEWQDERRVSEALDTVPDGTADGAHGEGTSEIVQGDPRARVSGVIHFY